MTIETGKLSPSVAKLKLQFKAFRDERLSSTDKTVFATLLTFHNGRTGRLDPGYDAIAKYASLGRSTVIRAIPRLVQAGYVTVTHRPLKRGNMTNTYQLAGVYAVNESTTAGTGQQADDKPASRAEIGRIMRGEETADKPATAAEISRIFTGKVQIQDTNACGEVVSQRDHPSVTAGPPPSVTAGPKLTEPLEQSERTMALSDSDGDVTEESTDTVELTVNGGASGQKVCLQGVEGGKAQAERQHPESRNGAASKKASPQRHHGMFGQLNSTKPKQVKLDGYANMLGGDVKAWTYLDDTLNAISEKHGCTSEMARRTLATKAIGARSGPELHRRLDAFTVPVVTAA